MELIRLYYKILLGGKLIMYHFPLVFETSSSLSYNSAKICHMPADVLSFLLHLIYLYAHVEHMSGGPCVCRSEDRMWESFFSFGHVCPGARTQVTPKCLCLRVILLAHLLAMFRGISYCQDCFSLLAKWPWSCREELHPQLSLVFHCIFETMFLSKCLRGLKLLIPLPQPLE